MRLLDNKQIVFISNEKTQQPEAASSSNVAEVSHDLTGSRVTSIDTPSQRFVCKSNRHYGVVLNQIGGKLKRKLYFMTYQQMLEGVRFILDAQGFSHRVE